MTHMQPEAAEPTGAPFAGADLSRQLRNLLLVRPLFELALRTRRTEEGVRLFAGLDTNYLALSLLDFIMEGSVFGFGRTREEVLGHLAERCRWQQPSLTDAEARRAAAEVVDALHNTENRTDRFEFEYFDAATRTLKQHRFHLLKWTRGDDDRHYYRVTDEGHLVYLGMLDLGSEDMQVLLDKMLAELIRRGRVEQALEVSERARREAMRYRDNIRSVLERTQRSPESVSWKGDLEPFLERARSHIDERHQEEDQLLSIVIDQLREASDLENRRRFARLRDTLDKELHGHLRLLQQVSEAGGRYRQAQKTMFRARRRQRLPDLEDALLPPLFAGRVGEVGALGEALWPFLLAPEAPRSLSFNQLCSLFVDSTARAGVEEGVEAELVPLEQLPPHFQQDVIDLAKDHVEQALRLAFARGESIDNEQILRDGEAKALPLTAQEYAMHALYELFSTRGGPVQVEKRGRFATRHTIGDRLVFRKVTPQNEDAND